MASIIKRGPAQYQAKVRRKGFPIRSRTFETHAEAKHWADVLEGKISGDEYVDRSREQRTTLRELIERYREEETPKKKGAQKENYRLNKWCRHPLADMPITSIEPADIAAWRKGRQNEGLAASSIRNEMNILSAIFKIAITEWGYRVGNPCAGVARPKQPPARWATLTAEQEETLLAECKKRKQWWVYHCVKLALTTAARAGEIRGLRYGNIHLDESYVLLPDTKNGTVRELPLTLAAKDAIQEAMDAAPARRLDDFVFGDPLKLVRDGGFPVSVLSDAFGRVAARAGMPDLTFHDLRHIATTRLAKYHEDALDLARTTGHKDLTQLRRYLNELAPDRAKRIQDKEAGRR